MTGACSKGLTERLPVCDRAIPMRDQMGHPPKPKKLLVVANGTLDQKLSTSDD